MKKSIAVCCAAVALALSACGTPASSVPPVETATPAPASTSTPAPTATPAPAETVSPALATDAAESTDNPLLGVNISTAPVMNGDGSKKVGGYAFVYIPVEMLQAATPEQFTEFVNTRIDGSGYNWFTIDLGDGTGVVFPGSTAIYATYATLNDDYSADETIGMVTLDSDGYVYAES